jgi:hypothetical protein
MTYTQVTMTDREAHMLSAFIERYMEQRVAGAATPWRMRNELQRLTRVLTHPDNDDEALAMPPKRDKPFPEGTELYAFEHRTGRSSVAYTTYLAKTPALSAYLDTQSRRKANDALLNDLIYNVYEAFGQTLMRNVLNMNNTNIRYNDNPAKLRQHKASVLGLLALRYQGDLDEANVVETFDVLSRHELPREINPEGITAISSGMDMSDFMAEHLDVVRTSDSEESDFDYLDEDGESDNDDNDEEFERRGNFTNRELGERELSARIERDPFFSRSDADATNRVFNVTSVTVEPASASRGGSAVNIARQYRDNLLAEQQRRREERDAEIRDRDAEQGALDEHNNRGSNTASDWGNAMRRHLQETQDREREELLESQRIARENLNDPNGEPFSAESIREWYNGSNSVIRSGNPNRDEPVWISMEADEDLF